MPARSTAALRPASLRSAPALAPERCALALGISAALLAPLALAAETAPAELAPAGPVAAAPAPANGGEPASNAAPATPAAAATVPATEAEPALATVLIEERAIDTNPYAEVGAPYKARVSGDARHVKPLAETPQTISVLTQAQMEDSGRTDLREVLQAQPGITLGTGENGNAFGDRYIIRGYEARSDVFVDGLRDPGMTIRESFVTEQVEISKGPSATFAGRGTVGGAVNSVSKQASTEHDFSRLKAGAGSDEFRRIELDANHVISDDAALRVNLLQAYEKVPDREPADRERNGYAASLLLTPLDKLEVIADLYHLEARDKPDLGTYIRPNGGAPVVGLPAYLQDQDFLSSDVDVATLRLNYDISDSVRITNASRHGSADNGYVATGARGTVRGTNDPDAGTATVTLSTHQGWQQVDYVANQTNLFVDTELAGMQHRFLFGVEYTDHKVLNGVYTGLTNPANANCITGTTATSNNGFCIVDTGGNYISNISSLMGRSITRGNWDSDYHVETTSFSVMDTVDLTERLNVFAGVRLDGFDYENTVQNTTTLVQTRYAYDEELWNYHLGTVLELNDFGNVYATWSTASEINGGESDLGANCGYGGICTVAGNPALVAGSRPETTENLELGTKWNLADDKLLLTAAVFQVTKDDVMEGLSANSYATTGTLNTGRNRVQGVEIGVTGNLTDKLSTQLGAATMKSEVLRSVVDPASVGRTLSNFADDSVFLQLRYQITPAFAFGGTATYASERYAGQPDSAAAWNATLGGYSYEVPDYTVFDVFANYEFTRQASVRVNVGNVTNEDYYLAAYRSGAFTYIGDRRNARVTLAYSF
ncbi:MAG: TonB-dependent siderophore receptor [Moraxellaceae bacterium]|jgi:catecholate siderophore receptor|nr:TonB-dependent siderophore receptor [Moraxellaceae bacterium]